MIKSLRGTNGSFVRIGNPQIQPVTDDDQSDIDLATNPTLGEGLPASQARLAMRAHTVDIDGMREIQDTSVEGLASAMSAEATIIPRMTAKFATVTTGYPKAKKLDEISKASNTFTEVKKFEPYEQLSAVSAERPEIVMVMDYRPLFDNDIGKRTTSKSSAVRRNLTVVGSLADVNMNVRALASDNANKLIKGIGKRSTDMNATFKARRITFKQSVDALRTSSMFLVNLIRKAERLKQQLDLRDESHIVPAHDLALQYVTSQLQSVTSMTSQRILDTARRMLPNKYDISDVFVRLGYSYDNVGAYSSTKLWLQLLAELKMILKSHSLEFIDIDPAAQRNDKSALVLTQDRQKRFVLPALATTFLPSWDSLRGIQPTQITQYVSAVSKSYDKMYESVHFKSDTARIAALLHVVSKEVRLSRALADEDVQRMLQTNYSYSQAINASNLGLFDIVLGFIGANVTNLPQLASKGVASLAHDQPAENLAVMTFESRYIEASNGTLTAGGAYYVDSALQPKAGEFDTARLDELYGKFITQARSLNAANKGLKLIIPSDRDSEEEKSATVADPVSMAEKVLHTFVDKQTGSTMPLVRDDRMSAVFSLASEDVALKSMLFMYTVCRATRTYAQGDLVLNAGQDNTTSTEQLITRITDRLKTLTNTSRATVQQVDTRQASATTNTIDTMSNDVLTHDAIVSALKTGTPLTLAIEDLFMWVVRAVNDTVPNSSQNTKVVINSQTRYTGTSDSAVMLAAFDMIISLVSRISNQKIVGRQSSRTNSQVSVISYSVLRTTNNHIETMRDVVGRIEKELALTQQVVYCVVHTLSQLASGIQSFSNYLKADSTKTTLKEIMKVVNDPTLMRLLMTEQQALLLASTVDDLYQKATASGVISTSGDVDKNGKFDDDDTDQILDDSVITPKLREALYATFGSSELSQRKDVNKKIIAVGLPQGFAGKIKQKVTASKIKRTTFNDRQSDIVKVVVYRVDMRHADIVYRPQKFMFEMSRFAVRNDEKFLELGEDPTLSDVISSIPTRDMMAGSDSDITYFSREGGFRLAQVKPSLSEPSYEFLSEPQKAELIRNHVMSYMLEVYVNLLTGISVAEHHFDMMPSLRMVEETFTQNLMKSSVLSISDNVKNSFNTQSGVMFAPQGKSRVVGENTFNTVNLNDKDNQRSNISKASFKSAGGKAALSNLHNTKVIAGIVNSVTPLSDPLRISKRLLTPKKFDRVFNLIVDPDEFEIDYEKTVRTKHGQKALERLIRSGDVQTLTGDDVRMSSVRLGGVGTASSGNRPGLIQGRSKANTIFKFRDRDKTAGDLSFDKYFVAIETMDEDEE